MKLSRRKFLGSTAIGAAAVGGTMIAASSLSPKFAAAAVGGASAGGVPAALSGLGTANRSAPVAIPASFAYSADVVVVGYGGAGAVAAITAYDAGANVLILEKTPTLAALGVANTGTVCTEIQGGGGNTHISGGICFMPLDQVGGALWHNSMSYGATPMAVSEAWAQMGVQNRAWLDSMNIPYAYSTTTTEYGNIVPGASTGFASCTPTGGGAGFFYYLDQLVQKRKIPVLFNTRGQELIQDPNTGEVIGVQALQNQSEVVNIQANKAVILSTGGFEFDARMKLNYLKCSPYHLGGWQYNTGDGIKMALKAGAGLWHMNTTSGRYSPWTPNYNTAWAQHHANNAWIWVDRYGNRFANESGLPSHSTWQVAVDWNFTYGQYSRVPALLIFDSTSITQPVAGGEEPRLHLESARPEQTTTTTTSSTSTSSQLVYGTGINQLPVQLGGTGALASAGFTGSAVGTPWSNNNAAEIAAGWVIQGADLPTLSANIANATIYGSNQGMAIPAGWNSVESMDNVTIPEAPGGGFGGTNCRNFSAANLTAAITQWNKDVAGGKGDTVFGRTAVTMAALSTPPYYAIALWPSGPNTNGGPIRDQFSRTCDPDYNPIPRLYSGGENGSVWGFLYMTGGNNGESISFGRIAGNNAANEAPYQWPTS